MFSDLKYITDKEILRDLALFNLVMDCLTIAVYRYLKGTLKKSESKFFSQQ